MHAQGLLKSSHSTVYSAKISERAEQ